MPPTTAFAGISFVTAELAPTMTFFPIVTPVNMVTLPLNLCHLNNTYSLKN